NSISSLLLIVIFYFKLHNINSAAIYSAKLISQIL
ncbi:hypothetical protein Zm00014a_029762, partial [Zea mays]